ncbi:hypothetical protein CK203_058819 [Vitis vinifera]|uniref:Uncharacterized protein n=1 Tax=Vitis vinifera TaxID=29760 RepID=A0A438GGC6_VITVI|nr:hypothetical protein CK203_058819 [Vitis vinifera]
MIPGMKSASCTQMPALHGIIGNGHRFHPTDEKLLTSPSPLPPQTPSFNYQQTMEDPQVSTRNPDGIGSRPASIPNASSILAPVSASLEPSKADQVVEIVEVTSVDQEIANRYSSTSTTLKPGSQTSLRIIRIVTFRFRRHSTR